MNVLDWLNDRYYGIKWWLRHGNPLSERRDRARREIAHRAYLVEREQKFDLSRLENSTVTLWTHKAGQCAGVACTVHNRSDHSMRGYPQLWRSDRAIMERVCPHGVGHPDPDEYKLTLNDFEGVHGCCEAGCCAP